jgi:regulator of CtrA degradation
MNAPHYELTPKLLSALYTEAMLLADEARAYFDRDPTANGLPIEVAVAFSCESLKVTTRLMHSIAWLLNQKALRAGELSQDEANSDARDLGYAPATDDYQLARFPDEARELIAASEDLYFRLSRVSTAMRYTNDAAPAPHIMIERIKQAF